jgi:hypothetical protein
MNQHPSGVLPEFVEIAVAPGMLEIDVDFRDRPGLLKKVEMPDSQFPHGSKGKDGSGKSGHAKRGVIGKLKRRLMMRILGFKDFAWSKISKFAASSPWAITKV